MLAGLLAAAFVWLLFAADLTTWSYRQLAGHCGITLVFAVFALFGTVPAERLLTWAVGGPRQAHGNDAKVNRQLPTRQEINPYDDLDGRVACEHFLGKTSDEAEALFHQSDIHYQHDLMWMGAPAFRYYLPAVFLYVRHTTGDISDFLSYFAGTLAFRVKCEPDELTTVASQLAEFCGYVLENWSRFGRGTEAYGGLRAQFEALHAVFRHDLDRVDTPGTARPGIDF
jgi:hypothetical protein